MEKEIWKPVKDYEGIYEVNNKSVVRSLDHFVPHKNGRNRIQKGRVLKTTVTYKGYINCSLSKEGKRFHTSVHRLSAIAFIPNPENKPQVNHKNTIKNDNRIENLEWCTGLENYNHSAENGLQNPNYGEDHHNSRLTNIQIRELKIRLKAGEKGADLAREFGLSAAAVSQIKLNRVYKNI